MLLPCMLIARCSRHQPQSNPDPNPTPTRPQLASLATLTLLVCLLQPLAPKRTFSVP